MNLDRYHGLDTLRAAAIILVFMFHYYVATHNPLHSFTIGRIGWVGVDLFFVLSGYLIGNQIFSTFIRHDQFSLKTFYFRRCLRTVPNYLFVLGLYFFIPIFREQPLITPLWKFLTFTQNFNLNLSAFSHAWSLCIEEQFYFILPLIIFLLTNKNKLRICWFLIGFILFAGIILRSSLWMIYIQHVGNKFPLYMSKIYYSSFCRLDGLVLGVSVALLKNFYKSTWHNLTLKGNWFMLIGIIGCYFTLYPIPKLFEFVPTAFGYLLRTVSFASLLVAALSSRTLLYRIKIPGAFTLSTWSYAIYLTHKQIIHISQSMLSSSIIAKSNLLILISIILFSLIGGWLLYTFVETPFLRFRDKFTKSKLVDQTYIGTISNMVPKI
jgi:peptidoglycan/LPS O-acetylase OafA/YrhL